MMKQIDAIRYRKAVRVSFMCWVPRSASAALLLEHRQHAIGDDEAAEDVDRGQRDGDEAHDLG